MNWFKHVEPFSRIERRLSNYNNYNDDLRRLPGSFQQHAPTLWIMIGQISEVVTITIANPALVTLVVQVI